MERRSGLTAIIREMCGLSIRKTVEVQSWEEFRPFQGSVFC